MNAPLKRPPSAAESAFAEQFAALDARLPSTARRAAFTRFAESGLPTRRVEAWHYTDLRAALVQAMPPTPAPDAAALEAARRKLARLDKSAGSRLVLVDGYYAPSLSDPPPRGAAVGAAPAPSSGDVDPLLALDQAMALGGLTLTIEAGAALAAPVEIVHVASGEGEQAVYSSLAAALGAGASATLVETFFGAGPGVQRHAAMRLTLGDAARLEHVAAIEDGPDLHVETQFCTLGAAAELDAFALVAGGALTRRQIFVTMAGEGGKLALGGLALIEGARHADTTLEVTHVAPNGESREFYRAIVADQGVGVFQGKIVVRPKAQKTDGAMKSQAILLSPTAQMHAKPELEIFADDVACGHGATVGALDPEQVFYLQARGLARREAEAILLEAFGAEAIGRVSSEAVAERLRGRLAAWLAARG